MLSAGTRLGPYELQSLIGSGGMGDVYQARDTRLNRDVAIKVLTPQLASAADFRARVDREARAISQLNHRHICTLYDIGDASGVDGAPGGRVSYLVMELIHGETLDACLARAPLSLAQALEYATQIADALDRAHGQGIVHGDLKPSNIMVTKAGIKLLDFGLATQGPPSAAVPSIETATHTAPVPPGSSVVGTLQYLAPERLEGGPSDQRSDIFACGAVIYEMVTGRKAFAGVSPAAVIAAIMREAPPSLRDLAPASPRRLERLVLACLEKDPAERWQSAGDLKRELGWMAASAGEEAVHAPSRFAVHRLWMLVSAALILVALGLGSTLYLQRGQETPSAVVRSSLLLPDGVRLPQTGTVGGGGRLAISPDGRHLAFTAVDTNGNQLLWVRALGGTQAEPIAGSDGAGSPFWSPDSQSVAFVAQGQLKTVDVDGGAPVVVAAPAINAPGAWAADNTILFTPTGGSPISRVPASGGTPAAVTTLDRTNGEVAHRNPFLLPDGRHFLFVAVGAQRSGETAAPRSVHVASVDGGDAARLLVSNASNPQYADGQLVFVRESMLLAQPFDAARQALSGQPRALSEQAELGGAGSAAYSLSAAGTLAYQPATSQGSQLVWFDRAGRQIGTLGQPGQYSDVELSPDGSQAAVSVLDPATNTRDIWVFDVARGIRTRFTFDRADDVAPIWSGDGTRILFTSNRGGHFDLFQRAASGVGPEEPVLVDSTDKYPVSWSRDNLSILYWTFDPAGTSLRLLSPGNEVRVMPFLGAPTSPGRFSPDGRWVAYYSTESGRSEIYAVPFPKPSRKWQISDRGGNFVRWARDGRSLYYISRDNKVMVVDINGSGAELQVGSERPLFEARPVGARYFYDVSPDGERVLVNTSRDANATSSIAIVQNWSATLRAE